MSSVKRALLWLMAAFYVFAGFNHLMNPAFYLAIMPPIRSCGRADMMAKQGGRTLTR